MKERTEKEMIKFYINMKKQIYTDLSEQYNKRDSPMGLVGIGKPASFFFCKHRIHHHPSPGLLAVPSPLPYPLPKQNP